MANGNWKGFLLTFSSWKVKERKWDMTFHFFLKEQDARGERERERELKCERVPCTFGDLWPIP
jgi:hypothetical protein